MDDKPEEDLSIYSRPALTTEEAIAKLYNEAVDWWISVPQEDGSYVRWKPDTTAGEE